MRDGYSLTDCERRGAGEAMGTPRECIQTNEAIRDVCAGPVAADEVPTLRRPSGTGSAAQRRFWQELSKLK
jgi:hypothetical protein